MDEIGLHASISPKQESINNDYGDSPAPTEPMSPEDNFTKFEPNFHEEGQQQQHQLEYVMSSRGLPKLVDNGCLFLRYRECGEKISWKCDLSASHHCKAKVYTQGEAIVKRTGEHSHAGNAAKIEIAKMMEVIYHRAQTTQDGTSQIVNDAIALLSPASVAQLPNVNSIKRLIHRNRSKKELLPPIPQSSEEFVVQDEYQCTEGGQEFLKADLTVGKGRLLIFATDQMLETLARCDSWFADANFKLAPSIFHKLCVILGVFADTVVPLVYALMSVDSTESYCSMFAKLLELEPTLNPRIIYTDFDMACYGAVSATFPGTAHFGCFFQFCQIYYSSIQAFNLQQKYESDAEFALKMRMLPALAFMPLEDVTGAFENLTLCSQLPVEATPLVDHFEDSWIGRPVCGKARRATVYPLRFWNCAEVADSNVVKLNSIFEAWHRYFNSHLTSPLGSNLWRLIKFFKSDQAKNEVALTQIFGGGEEAARAMLVVKWQPKMHYKKLENVLATQNKTSPIELLQNIASCLFF